MAGTREAFSRVMIDAHAKDAWDALTITAVRFRNALPDRAKVALG